MSKLILSKVVFEGGTKDSILIHDDYTYSFKDWDNNSRSKWKIEENDDIYVKHAESPGWQLIKSNNQYDEEVIEALKEARFMIETDKQIQELLEEK